MTAVGQKLDLSNPKSIQQISKSLPKLTDLGFVNSLRMANEFPRDNPELVKAWKSFMDRAEHEAARRLTNFSAEQLVEVIYQFALAGAGSKK